MKSRITIDLDFDNGNRPIIQILYRNSDDIRDALIESFFQKLGGDSSWCKIVFKQHEINPICPDFDFIRLHISPISPTDLPNEHELMWRAINYNKAVESHPIRYIPCAEDDPGYCGTYTSSDGQHLCHLKELK